MYDYTNALLATIKERMDQAVEDDDMETMVELAEAMRLALTSVHTTVTDHGVKEKTMLSPWTSKTMHTVDVSMLDRGIRISLSPVSERPTCGAVVARQRYVDPEPEQYCEKECEFGEEYCEDHQP